MPREGPPQERRFSWKQKPSVLPLFRSAKNFAPTPSSAASSAAAASASASSSSPTKRTFRRHSLKFGERQPLLLDTSASTSALSPTRNNNFNNNTFIRHQQYTLPTTTATSPGMSTSEQPLSQPASAPQQQQQHQQQQQQQQPQQIPSTTSAPAPASTPASVSASSAATPATASRHTRRGSVLGASRKLVNATVRRPLRSVGRFVRNRDRNQATGQPDDDDDAPMDPEYESILMDAAAAGVDLATESNDVPVHAVDVGGPLEASNILIQTPIKDQQQHTSRSSLIMESSSRGIDLLQDPTLSTPQIGTPVQSNNRATAATANAGASANSNNSGGVLSYGRNNNNNNNSDDPDWPVKFVEQTLRYILLILGAYIFGANQPKYLHHVGRATEYTVTAWITCVIILILAFIQKHYPQLIRRTSANATTGDVDTSRIYSNNDYDQRLYQNEGYDRMQHRQSIISGGADTLMDPSFPASIGDGSNNDSLTLLPPADNPDPILTPPILTSSSSQNLNRSLNSKADLGLATGAPISRAVSEDSVDNSNSALMNDDNDTDSGYNVHPSLDPFYIMNSYTGERLRPNGPPILIETEWFTMHMAVLIRTPDVDDPNALKTPANQKAADYLRPKQRRFEFQYQLKLKKVPQNKAVYFACELDEPIKMGIVQRAFVGAAMAFVKGTNPTFHYSIMGSKKCSDDKYEQPHMSFTVEGSLDRLVVTKPGETPPQLLTPIEEDPEHFKRRKKGALVDWNTQDTYTLALWSAYVDFLEWRVINLPGIRPFFLDSVIGQQAMKLTMYFIDENRGNDKHYVKDIEHILSFELCNSNQTPLGPVAKKWAANYKAAVTPKKGTQQAITKNANSTKPTTSGGTAPATATNKTAPAAIDKETSGTATATGGGLGAPGALASSILEPDSPSQRELQYSKSADDAQGEDGIDDVDQDAQTAAELGEGIYLRSGDSVVLREFMMDNEAGEGAAGEEQQQQQRNLSAAVANGGGFVVLRTEEEGATIVIEKAKKSNRNRLIKTGDTVMFKMIQKRGEDTETRYLSIHRGWWLKWVSSVPTKNGYFTIYTHDSEFKDDKNSMRTGETQSSYLTIGGSFWLRHKRWSSYHVGVAAEESTTYGGRMLGLYNPQSNRGGRTASSSSAGGGGGTAADHENYQSEGEGDDIDEPEMGEKAKALWMKPLQLCAIEPIVTAQTLLPRQQLDASEHGGHGSSIGGGLDGMEVDFSRSKLRFSSQDCQLDVPAWIEMMNRTERIRQLTYVVRITPSGGGVGANNDDDNNNNINNSNNIDTVANYDDTTFVRLRTGRELTDILRVGLAYRNLGHDSNNGNGAQRGNLYESSSQRRKKGTQWIPEGTPKAVPRQSFVDGTSTPPKVTNSMLTLSPGDNGNGGFGTGPNGKPSPTGGANGAVDFSFDDLGLEGSEEESVDSGDEDYPQPDQYNWVDGSVSPDAAATSPDEQEAEDNEVVEVVEVERERPHGAVQKGRSIIGKVAKTAKNATVVTGKTAVKTVVGTGKLTGKVALGTSKLTSKVAVGTGKIAVRQSKKVAKGTVNAGKAITVTAGKAVVAPLSRKSKKPPKAEPRAKQTSKARKRQEKDLQVEVSKSMRRIEKLESKKNRPPTVLAGELCAPEQSCRTAARVLSRMSSVSPNSPYFDKVNNVLSSNLSVEYEQDRWFLQGSSVQIGVSPSTGDKSKGMLIYESLVARCLWESHWREEWCGMYETCVALYPPLSSKPILEIAYIDIQCVRPLDDVDASPLPGFPLLVLETAWLCHYFAFRDEEARDTFGEKVEDAISLHMKQEMNKSAEEKVAVAESELRSARFWQGFQNLSETSLSSGRGKWAKISSNQKMKYRTVLNGRRMVFDLPASPENTNGYTHVENMLTTALSFSLDSLEKNPGEFVKFLDSTSQLRSLNLEEIDSSSRHAFCLFVNIYHCLLQHGLLLAVNGPLQKRSVGHFMRTTCYEIGGDVFSLAEIHSCIIRGKMSRPVNPKPPYIEAPKKSSAYQFYALDYTDARVNFAVHTGDIACPASVPVYRPHVVEEQLNEAAAIFLKKQLYIDTSRRLVVLPKVCEVYKHDFGQGDSHSCLRFCIGGLDEATASTIRLMMMDESTLVIRYQHSADQFHTSFKLRESPSPATDLSATF